MNPIRERHQYLQSAVTTTAEDFATDPELTEFSILDTEDWEIDDK
jgi:hypothetical protein